jgi:hypothetical protein
MAVTARSGESWTSHDLLSQSKPGLGCSVGRPSASRLSIQVRQTHYGHFEARFNGSLPHRPIEVGLHQGVDVRRNGFGVLFKYAKPITADIHPLVEPHLNGAVRQRAIEARLEAWTSTSRRASMARCLTAPLRWGSTKGWMSAVMGLAL